MHLLMLIVACGGATKDDTANDMSADTGSDSGTADSGETEDTDPGTASISGSVTAFDGTHPAGMEVQVCDQLCIPVTTDANGNFSATGLDGGSYKVDALGEGVDGANFGRMRAHVDLEPGGTATLAFPLFLPQMSAPATLVNGANTVGGVTLTLDPSVLDAPFGFDEGVVSTGVVSAADIPDAWGVPSPAAAAVAFLPFATEVSGSFTFSVTGTWDAAGYDVYAVDAKGKLEGPLATATVEGGTLSATVQPSLLTWLLVVPRS